MQKQPNQSKARKPSTAIIICTEPHFENKSILLARSIRNFAGALKNVDIISYSPRNNMKPTAKCLNEFDKLEVKTILNNLNTSDYEYPLANKPFIASHAETTYSYEQLILLDSDKIILSEPTEFISGLYNNACIRPVDGKNIGISDLNDDESEYWKTLYKITGKRYDRTIFTSTGNQCIFEYYNSGMVAVKTKSKIFETWLNNYKKTRNSNILPAKGIFFVEQSVLSATISSICSDLHILPKEYNIPIHFIDTKTEYFTDKIIRNCVSLHYHSVLDKNNWKTFLRNPVFSKIDQYKLDWLHSNLEDLKF